MTFSKKVPRVSDGFGILMWRVNSSAHNLTVIQTARRKLDTILNNICTVLTLKRIEHRNLEPKHSICDVNVSTVPTRFPIIEKYQNSCKEQDYIYQKSVTYF